MLRKSYGTCMRCWNAYLGWRELPAATGQLGLEGPEANLRNRCWRANATWGKVISSRNQLSTKGKRLVVQLPDDLQGEAVFGGGSEFCKFLQIYFFQFMEQFSEKLKEALYIGWHLYRRCKIVQNGAFFITIQNLVTFLGQNFQVILWRELERNNLGNYLGGYLNIIPATVFPISCYFLRIKIAATA